MMRATLKPKQLTQLMYSAKCEEDGKGRYTADFTTNEAFEDQTKDIVLEKTGHSLVAHAATDETCTTVGNTAYWSCENCDKYFSDAEGTTVIAADSWVIPAHPHTLTNHVAVSETCDTDGNVEYWTCSECNQYFLDTDATQVTTAQAVVIAAHHTLTHHDKEPESCTSNGMIEYWECTVCHKDFFDEAATREIENEDDYIIPMHHTLTQETCTEDGNKEYWNCSVCGKYFFDKDAENETTQANVIVAKKEHAWGEPTYEWNQDMTECTAKRVCANDSSHIETETVGISSGVITDEDDENPGIYGDGAIFENKAFVSQSINKNNFSFKKNDDDKSYILTGFDANTTSEPVTIPTKINDLPVIAIGENCFAYNNTQGSCITSIVIPEGIVELGKNAFRMCVYMTSITFPKSLVTVGESCFSNCRGLTTVAFQEGLEVIQKNAFYSASKITTIILPSTVTALDEQCFYGCSTLSTLNFAGTKEQWGAITKGTNWRSSTILSVVHCSDGDINL